MDKGDEQTIREAAYLIWENEGRPDGCAVDHWMRAVQQVEARLGTQDPLEGDTEAVIEGNPEADYPAVLTKDVPGG